jgi:soluble lytic murein transglycosylase
VLAIQQAGAELIVDAREAFRKKDRSRLAALRIAANTARHPLAPWVEYWELNLRLPEASSEEVSAFFARWPGTYVEDRLRNDWLLEAGRRRDWASIAREYPRFRMDDDREVSCYAALAEFQRGADPRSAELRERARNAWLAQREADDGCQQLAVLLVEARALSADDLWMKARLAVENNKLRLARNTAALVDTHAARSIAEVLDNPLRYLRQNQPLANRTHAELALLAVLRTLASDGDTALALLQERWQDQLSGDRDAWAWAFAGRQAALKLQPEAAAHYQRAFSLLGKRSAGGGGAGWSEDTLAWGVRAALRSAAPKDRWPLVLQTVRAMSPAQQKDPAWQYWLARALAATARAGEAGEAQRAESRRLLEALAGPLSFYAKLAADELGQAPALPAAPAPLTEAEREAVQGHEGFARGLKMIAIGLRSEGVREFNFHLRGLGDRELLAAAQLACEREVWDRCISASERTRELVDLRLRFPTPYREQVLARAREVGVEPAFVYGLVRQESRFVADARSGVGASGLMQLMPATARWTAAKVGLPYGPAQINDRDTNLRLGSHYLRLLLQDFEGSMALAAAAYNAGPNRPRRWREGAVLEPAMWVENVPFNETRDYVKKVLSNTVIYAALLDDKPLRLGTRLGKTIGPRDPAAPAAATDLP